MNFENLKDMKEFCKYNKIDVSNLLWDTCEESQEKIEALKAENERLTKLLKNSVQLPCKVGDTVYWLYSKGATGWHNDIRVCKVSSISISEHYIEIHSERTSLNDTNFWGRIGDNVFLTKESAEARLKELEALKAGSGKIQSRCGVAERSDYEI